MTDMALWRRLTAESIGSAFLAAVVIGSGISAQQLSPGNTGLQLFENAAATAAGLFAIILMFGPVSGGHFNPVVSFVDAAFGGLSWRDASAYLPAQVAGCSFGAVVANLMFSRAAFEISTKHRASAGAMTEWDMDISRQQPKKLTDEMARAVDVVVTMGCGDACPVYPGKRYVDWELPDPAGRPIEEVRPIRDEIADRVDALLAELLQPDR